MSDSKSPTRLIIMVVAIIAIIVIVLGMVLTYNSLVSKRQDVKRTWGNIEAAYQMRIDKIPQMLNAVNSSMTFERGLLENITALRTQWLNQVGGSVNANVNTTEALDSNISVLLVAITENYPDLQSVDAVQQFMSAIDETENVILAQRVFYNDAVASFNSASNGFPGMLFGFGDASYYERGQ